MHDTEIHNDNKELTDKSKKIPDHMQLLSFEEILKMQQHPRTCNKTFTFFVEHLAGAIIGQKNGRLQGAMPHLVTT